MHEREAEVRKLAISVFAANGRLISAGNELVAHLGLTSAWWQVLAALRYASEPLPAASIARNMGLTRQAVQRIVDLLAERKLIEFQPNPHHRRAKLIILTQAGIKAVSSAEQAVAHLDQEIVGKIGEERIRDAIATLQEMITVISDNLDSASSPSSPTNNPQ